ncbi:MAG: radical SAM family heme chaperone HemW [bacterium]|nr:MAG: radical SAM family heme chaperone HemW [bacterium]
MKAGLYIHIPFCIKKCAYCDFYSTTTEPSKIEQFLNAAENEVELYTQHPVFAQIKFRTLYIGGGTPSLLSAQQIDKLFQKVLSRFHFAKDFEFTIEANPETISFSKLKDYRSVGVNRLSLGVQSFSDLELQTLGRIHNTDQAKKCIEWASQAGFDNINLDLIFAIPDQSLSGWQTNLEQAIQFKPKHLSIYCLTIEPGTPFERQISSGKIKKVNEETEREMYLWSLDALSKAGYEQYEISNFTLPDFECNHNLSYWNGSPYLGIGPSAHSFWNGYRQWNVDSLDHYLKYLKIDKKPIADQETLSREQKLLEFLYLSMRTTHGVDIRQFEDLFNLSFTRKFGNVLKYFQRPPDGELFHFQNNKLKLTADGFVLFDKICQYFAEEI